MCTLTVKIQRRFFPTSDIHSIIRNRGTVNLLGEFVVEYGEFTREIHRGKLPIFKALAVSRVLATKKKSLQGGV